MIVVSEIGEQWSPQTAPDRQDAIEITSISYVSAEPNTPQTIGIRIAKVPQLVPVENCLKMAMALSAKDVPYELHILPEGEHGLSVCTNEVATPDDYNGRWVEWSIAWMNKLFSFHA